MSGHVGAGGGGGGGGILRRARPQGLVVKVTRFADEACPGTLVIGKRRRMNADDEGVGGLEGMMRDLGRRGDNTGGFRVFELQKPAGAAGAAAASPTDAAPATSARKRTLDEVNTLPVEYEAPRLVKRGRHAACGAAPDAGSGNRGGAVIEIASRRAAQAKRPRSPRLCPPGYEGLMRKAYGQEEAESMEVVEDTYVVCEGGDGLFASDADGAEAAAMERFEVDFDVEDLIENGGVDPAGIKKLTWVDDDGSEDSQDENHPRFDYPEEGGDADGEGDVIDRILKEGNDSDCDASSEGRGPLGEDDEDDDDPDPDDPFADPYRDVGSRYRSVRGEADLVADYTGEGDAFYGGPLYSQEAFDPDRPLSDILSDTDLPVLGRQRDVYDAHDAFNTVGDSEDDYA